MSTRTKILRRKNGGPYHSGPYHDDEFYKSHDINETVAVLTQAVEANEKQISDLSVNTSRNIRDVTSLLKEQGTHLSAKIEALAAAFAASRVTNWPLIIGLMMAISVFVGAAYKITDLQTQVTMAPIAAKAEVSEKDRSSLHNEVVIIRSDLEIAKSQQRVINAQLKEVETQFRASDQARNTQFAEQQRTNNILMQLAQKEPVVHYPTAPFYFPEISRAFVTPAN